MYSIADTTWQEVTIANRPLVDRHTHELDVSRFPELMHGGLDLARYENLDAQGLLHVLGVWRESQMVGYAAIVLIPHPHHMSVTLAITEAIYVAPEHRGGAGVMLIHATERKGKALGAAMSLLTAQPDTALNTLLPRMRYGVFSTTYFKEL